MYIYIYIYIYMYVYIQIFIKELYLFIKSTFYFKGGKRKN